MGRCRYSLFIETVYGHSPSVWHRYSSVTTEWYSEVYIRMKYSLWNIYQYFIVKCIWYRLWAEVSIYRSEREGELIMCTCIMQMISCFMELNNLEKCSVSGERWKKKQKWFYLLCVPRIMSKISNFFFFGMSNSDVLWISGWAGTFSLTAGLLWWYLNFLVYREKKL